MRPESGPGFMAQAPRQPRLARASTSGTLRAAASTAGERDGDAAPRSAADKPEARFRAGRRLPANCGCGRVIPPDLPARAASVACATARRDVPAAARGRASAQRELPHAAREQVARRAGPAPEPAARAARPSCSGGRRFGRAFSPVAVCTSESSKPRRPAHGPAAGRDRADDDARAQRGEPVRVEAERRRSRPAGALMKTSAPRARPASVSRPAASRRSTNADVCRVRCRSPSSRSPAGTLR